MFIYKKLKASDVGITAFEAHKEFNVTKDNTASLGISLLDSSFSSASRDTYSGISDVNNHKNYFQLDHLFYNDALFNYGNLIGGINYNQQEKRLYNKATIVSISQKNFGNSIQKGSIDFNNNLIDDSKGNLYSKTTILTNFPKDKERVFYLGPVKGHKYFDLTRNPDTGESIVNFPSSVNDIKLDDSLYTNVIEYISCSFSEDTILNCPIISLNDGYIKAPHNKSYNFGSEDFTLTFWYKPTSTTGPKFILGKSTTKTVVKTPESSPNSDLKSTHGSASLLQPKEVDAGRAFPFEVIFDSNRKIKFSRADQDDISSVTYDTALDNNTFSHVAVRKTGSELKVFINGNSGSNHAGGIDRTDLCKNEADFFIGSQGGTRENIGDYNKEHSISQLMVFNKGLTHKEIINVSSSITGTPFVGNVFYENGILTLTSPTVNNNTLTSLQTLQQDITLLPTAFDYGPSNISVFEKNTFSGLFTFISDVETVTNASADVIATSLNFDSRRVSSSFTGTGAGTVISLFSLPTASLTLIGNPSILLKPIFSSSFDLNADGETQLNPLFVTSSDLIGNVQVPNNGDSAELIADRGHTLKINNEESIIIALDRPKLFSASFTIDPVLPTSVDEETWLVTSDAIGQFDPVTNLNSSQIKYEFDTSDNAQESNYFAGADFFPPFGVLDGFQSQFDFGNGTTTDSAPIGQNDGGVANSRRLVDSTTNQGEIAFTGSKGFVSVFTNVATAQGAQSYALIQPFDVFTPGLEGVSPDPDQFKTIQPRITALVDQHGLEGAEGFAVHHIAGIAGSTFNLSLSDNYTGDAFNQYGNNTDFDGADIHSSAYTLYSGVSSSKVDIAEYVQGDVLTKKLSNTAGDAPQQRFKFGPAAQAGENNKFFSKYFKSPGKLKFRISIVCAIQALGIGTQPVNIQAQRRIQRHDGTLVSDWTDIGAGNDLFFDSLPQNPTSQTITGNETDNDFIKHFDFEGEVGLIEAAFTDSDESGEINQGPVIDFRLQFTLQGSNPNLASTQLVIFGDDSDIFPNSNPEVKIWGQEIPSGFYSHISVRTEEGLITGNPGDIIKYDINGINLGDNELITGSNAANALSSGSYALPAGPMGINAVTQTSGPGAGTLGPSPADRNRIRSILRPAKLHIQLRKESNHEIVKSHIFTPRDTFNITTNNTDQDLQGTYSVPSTEDDNVNYYLKLFIGDEIGTPLFTNSPEGFSIQSASISKFSIPNDYTISSVDSSNPELIGSSDELHQQLSALYQVNTLGADNVTGNLLLQNKGNQAALKDLIFDNEDFLQNTMFVQDLFVGTALEGIALTSLNPDKIKAITNLDGNFGNKITFGRDFEDDLGGPGNIPSHTNAGVLITSSLGITASIEIQGNVEVTSSFIPVQNGIHQFSNLTLNTTGLGSTDNGGKNKLAVRVFKNGTALNDPLLVNPGLNDVNIFLENPLSLGNLTTTDVITYKITSVSASSTTSTLVSGALNAYTNGLNESAELSSFSNVSRNSFEIVRSAISVITSSKKVEKLDGSAFELHDTQFIEISSSHFNVGDAAYPFNVGQATASIVQLLPDAAGTPNMIAELNEDFFITSSLNNIVFGANIFEKGPFVISASLTGYETIPGAGLTSDPKEFGTDTLINNMTLTNDAGTDNIGFGYRLNGANIGRHIEIFRDTAANFTENYADSKRIRNSAPTDINLESLFFVSGTSSPDYPNGIVTASLNYTQSFTPNLTLKAVSGSRVSSGDTITAEEFAPYLQPDGVNTYSSEKLAITSSHTSNDSIGGPQFPLGNFEVEILQRNDDGSIEIDEVLFITASAEATASSPSSSATLGEISFTQTNTLETVGATEELIGGTFNFDNQATPEASVDTFLITDVSDNGTITIQNQSGGPDNIQTTIPTNLTANSNVTVNYSAMVPNEFTLDFKNDHLIFENEYHCTVDEHEYNFTLNPTARKLKSINDGELASFATGSNFKPYVTTIGLYNDLGELLIVGKLGQPVRMSDETDTTFVVRYDT